MSTGTIKIQRLDFTGNVQERVHVMLVVTFAFAQIYGDLDFMESVVSLLKDHLDTLNLQEVNNVIKALDVFSNVTPLVELN